MAQLPQNSRSPYLDSSNAWTFTASLATALGDACYLVTGTGKVSPASSFPDAGDEASTQRAFAALFMGIAGSEQPVTDPTSRTAKLYRDQDLQVACDSTTFTGVEYLAPKYTAGVLSPQAFVKTTDRSRAIAKVTAPYTAATTLVWARFSSRILGGLLLDAGVPDPTVCFRIDFSATDATRVVAVITRPMRLVAASSVFTTASTSGTWTVEKLTGTTAPGSGTALLSAPIALSGTANTVANGTVISTEASINFAAGDRLGIKIAGTMTNLVGGVGTISLTPF